MVDILVGLCHQSNIGISCTLFYLLITLSSFVLEQEEMEMMIMMVMMMTKMMMIRKLLIRRRILQRMRTRKLMIIKIRRIATI